MDRALAVLRQRDADIPFAELVRTIAADVNSDEATIKAAILRLNSGGELEITPDWNVHLRRAIDEPSQAA